MQPHAHRPRHGPGGAGRTTARRRDRPGRAPAGARRHPLLSADRTGHPRRRPRRATGADPDRGRPGLHRLAPRRRRPTSAPTSSPSRTAPPPPSTCSAPPASTTRNSPNSPAPRNFALLRALRDARAVGRLGPARRRPAARRRRRLALLALPEQLRRYLRRLLPPERQAARALRPVLGQLAGVPMPAEWLYETAARWDIELAAVQAVVDDPRHRRTAGRRARPGRRRRPAHRPRRPRPARPARRRAGRQPRAARPASADTWLAALAAQQQQGPGGVARGVRRRRPRPRGRRTSGRDPRGADDLAALLGGAGRRSAGRPGRRPPVRRPGPSRTGSPTTASSSGTSRCPAPYARSSTWSGAATNSSSPSGPFRRIVPLPSALRRCTVAGAALRDGELRIRFAPDPDLWPQDTTERAYPRSGNVESTNRSPGSPP